MKKYDSVARLLGIDVGRKYNGLAVSDKGLISAKPYKTLVIDHRDPRCLDETGLFHALKNTIRNKNIKGIVVGYPLDADGKTTVHCLFIEEFLETLAV